MKNKLIVYLMITSCLLLSCSNNTNVGMEAPPIEENIVISKEEDIKKKVEEIAGENIENIAVYYYKLNGAEEYYLNKDKYYIAASTRKVPQVMEVLDNIKKGIYSLDTEIEYDEKIDYEEGTGILQYEEYIDTLPIKEIIELSLIYSDNIADNMLDRLSENELRIYIEDITGENNIPIGNYTTAQQQYKIYERLYNNPDNNENYPMVLEILKETEFHDRLDKYIPHEITAHKIGNYNRYYHDTGIVDISEPYILVVLTKDIGELNKDVPDTDERNLIDWGEEAFELIAQISKGIYDIVSSEGK